MDDSSTSEDIFRTWKLTPDEAYEEIFNSLLPCVNSTPAWHHFEKLFASRGYELRYYITPRGLLEDPEQDVRRPIVDLNNSGLGDPFKPDVTKAQPFVFHDPGGFSEAYEKITGPWFIMRPRLIFAYDKYNRIVVIKALTVPDHNSEVEILKMLNSEPLRSCAENHTIPLLEHIVSDEGWQFLVMPAWRMGWESYFKAWEVDEYFNVITQWLEGLAFMHKNGIAHCDVSVGNMVFNQDGTALIDGVDVEPIISQWDFRVAIIDFGLAIRFDPHTDPSTWVSTNDLGTLPYNSPEKRSVRETGIPYQVLPADVYALGASFKHILAREEEEINDTRKLIKYPVLAHDVLKRHVPQFESILNSMTDEDPTKRPTAQEALDQLKSTRDSLPNHIRYSPADGYPISLISGHSDI